MKNSGNSGDFPWNFTDGASSEAHPGIQHIRESKLFFIPAWNSRHRDPPRISRGHSRRTHGAAGMRTGFPGDPDRGHSQIFFFFPQFRIKSEFLERLRQPRTRGNSHGIVPRSCSSAPREKREAGNGKTGKLRRFGIFQPLFHVQQEMWDGRGISETDPVGLRGG